MGSIFEHLTYARHMSLICYVVVLVFIFPHIHCFKICNEQWQNSCASYRWAISHQMQCKTVSGETVEIFEGEAFATKVIIFKVLSMILISRDDHM